MDGCRNLRPGAIGVFLRAGPERLREWVLHRQSNLVTFCVVAIVLGAGAYGAVMGSWRSPWQAFYTGIKLPLVILLTTLGNGLLNGMLAPLLGLNLTFRQSLAVVLMSFAVVSVTLGALSPVAWFVVWNTPPLTADHAVVISRVWRHAIDAGGVRCAGRHVGNLHLLPLLSEWARSASTARNVLFAWLAGNLFLGSQICWVLRPFIWDPARPVEFIGREYFHGSFFETVFEAARRLIFS